jgi:hypothetical protein
MSFTVLMVALNTPTIAKQVHPAHAMEAPTTAEPITKGNNKALVKGDIFFILSSSVQ